MTVPRAVVPHDSSGRGGSVDRFCDAKTRPGAKHARCRRPAGWGTDHAGVGRCKLHGGKNPVRHGRYSALKPDRLRELITQYEADPDPLNMLSDLAAMRALFTDYVERYDEWRAAFLAWHASFHTGATEPKPMKVMDLADAGGLLAEVTKIVERIERVRAQNAISRPDLNRVIGEMGRVVDTIVDDDTEKQRIKEGWLAIRI